MAHDEKVSILKAVCIILMVMGHAGCPDWLFRWIYLFHMPCFFFLSGYLLKDRYLDDVWGFIKRKVTTLYFPFVGFSLLFLLLHNPAVGLGLCTGVKCWSEIWREALNILTFRNNGVELLSSFWFLKTLFSASILSLLTLKLICVVFKVKTPGAWLAAGISVGFLVFAFGYNHIGWSAPMLTPLTFYAASFYMAGYAFSKVQWRPAAWQGAGALIGVFCLSTVFHESINVTGPLMFAYFAVAVVSSIACYGLCGALVGKGALSRSLDFIGSRTLYILALHFVCFKLVSLLKMWALGLPASSLQEVPVISESNAWWWLLYTAVGVAIPLLLRLRKTAA